MAHRPSSENALVENNEIVDATDVPIVLFRSDMGDQRSLVRNNRILNAGNSAYGGLVIDPLTNPAATYSFAGSSVTNNLLWTGSRVHYDIGISVGTRAWFNDAAMGNGVSVTNNTTDSVPSRMDTGIAVSRMLNATVQDNTLSIIHVDSSFCPNLDVVAAVSAGDASGSIQSYTDQPIDPCVGHRDEPE